MDWSNSLITLGTVTTGTWNATSIGTAYGGTGLGGGGLKAGYIPFGAGTSAFATSTNLFWDTSNLRLGIGTTSPYATLSVAGGVVGAYFTATTTTASTFPYASTTALSATSLCLTGSNCITSWPTGGSIDQLGQIGDVSTSTLGSGYTLSYQGTTWQSTSTLYISSNGNIGIGTTTPGAKLAIGNLSTDSARPLFTVASSTASATTTLFTILNTGAVSVGSSTPPTNTLFQVGTSTSPLLYVDKNSGNVGIGTAAPTSGYGATIAGNGKLLMSSLGVGGSTGLIDFYTSAARIAYGGSSLPIGITGSTGSTASGMGVTVSNAGTSINPTSGTGGVLDVFLGATNGFNPTSGSAVFNILTVDGTIYQTSAASGITRGIYINPTITSARDYRNLEIASATYTLSTSTYSTNLSNIYNVLFNPITYATASSSALTFSNASTLNIAGAPLGSSLLTISSSTALSIQSNALSYVTNGYGLYVQAPTGATNNYAAAFMGGNVGIGTTNPEGQLHLLKAGGAQIFLSDSMNTSAIRSVEIGGADGLAFFTSGTTTVSERMRITDAGKVGIGTTSPYATLSVAGQVVGAYFTATTTTVSNFPYASTTALSAQSLCLTGDNCRTTWPTGSYPAQLGQIGDVSTSTLGSGYTLSYQGTTWQSTSTLYISSNGNIGIGTTTPGAKLAIGNLSTDSVQPLFTVASSTASATTTLFTILNNGSVGIGTAAPAYKLTITTGDINLSSSYYLRGNASILIMKDGTTKIGSTGATNIYLYAGYATARMVINNSPATSASARLLLMPNFL